MKMVPKYGKETKYRKYELDIYNVQNFVCYDCYEDASKYEIR